MSERLKRWQRIEVPQISHAWVEENCHRVTDRDIELGQLLIKRKLLRRDQIAVLHEGFRNLANPAVQINRRLRALFDLHFVDKAFPSVLLGEGSSQAVISLDRAGAILLNVPFRQVIRHQRTKQGKIYRTLPLNYRHTLGVNDFEVSVVQWCQANVSELIRWRLEFENERRFQFNGQYKIRPDGFGVVQFANRGKAFFFEYDTGTEDAHARRKFKVLSAKFKAYAAYKRSGAWLAEDWAKKFREFPPVIFLTEDTRRINALRELAATFGVQFIIDHFSKRNEVIWNFFT